MSGGGSQTLRAASVVARLGGAAASIAAADAAAVTSVGAAGVRGALMYAVCGAAEPSAGLPGASSGDGSGGGGAAAAVAPAVGVSGTGEKRKRAMTRATAASATTTRAGSVNTLPSAPALMDGANGVAAQRKRWLAGLADELHRGAASLRADMVAWIIANDASSEQLDY